MEDLKTQHFADLTAMKQDNDDLAKLVEEKVKVAQLQSELSDVKQQLVLSQYQDTTSSFVQLLEKEFKEFSLQVSDRYTQQLIALFKGLTQIQEDYNDFEHQSDLLEDHM